jgi:hypothetical protein
MLIAALSSAQLLCLLVAFLWFGNWLQRGLSELLRTQSLANNSRVAAQISEVLRQWQVKSI